MSNSNKPSEALSVMLRPVDVAAMLNVSKRTIERQRSAGKFPKPDIQIGRCVRWNAVKLRQWIDNQPNLDLSGM